MDQKIQENQNKLAVQIANGEAIGENFAQNAEIRKLNNESNALKSIKDTALPELYKHQKNSLDKRIDAMARSLNKTFIEKASNDSIFDYMEHENTLKETMSNTELATYNQLKEKFGYESTRTMMDAHEGNIFTALVKLNGFNSMSQYQDSQKELKKNMEQENEKIKRDEHQINLMARAITKALNNK